MKNIKTFEQFVNETKNVNEKWLSFKPEIGLGKKIKSVKDLKDGDYYWINDKKDSWYQAEYTDKPYQRKGENFFNSGGNSLSYTDKELDGLIKKGNVYFTNESEEIQAMKNI